MAEHDGLKLRRYRGLWSQSLLQAMNSNTEGGTEGQREREKHKKTKGIIDRGEVVSRADDAPNPRPVAAPVPNAGVLDAPNEGAGVDAAPNDEADDAPARRTMTGC